MNLLTKIAFIFLAVHVAPEFAHAELCESQFTQGPISASVEAVVGKPHLIIFSAPSGGGKTTLANLLLQEFPNLIQSISSTTRAPRGTEQDGVDYHFLRQTDFEQKIKAGNFAEYAQVHGNYYGTDSSVIRNAFANGKSVLALVDVAGAQNLRAAFPNEVYSIFISPPDMNVLEARLRGRGTETEEAIQKRLANARAEMAQSVDFQSVIVNDDLQRAQAELSVLFHKLGLVPDAKVPQN